MKVVLLRGPLAPLRENYVGAACARVRARNLTISGSSDNMSE